MVTFTTTIFSLPRTAIYARMIVRCRLAMTAWLSLTMVSIFQLLAAQESAIYWQRLLTETDEYPPLAQALARQDWGRLRWRQAFQEKCALLKISSDPESRYMGLAKVTQVKYYYVPLHSEVGEAKHSGFLAEVRLLVFLFDVIRQEPKLRAEVVGYAAQPNDGPGAYQEEVALRLLTLAFVESAEHAVQKIAQELLPQEEYTRSAENFSAALPLAFNKRRVEKVKEKTGRFPDIRKVRKIDLRREWEKSRGPTLTEKYADWPGKSTELGLHAEMEKTRFRIGECAQIKYRTGQDGYVYLFNMTGEEEVQMLLPLVGYPRDPQNWTGNGWENVYPLENADFPFHGLEMQKEGKELFVLLFCREKLSVFERALANAYRIAREKEGRQEEYDFFVPLGKLEMEKAREEAGKSACQKIMWEVETGK